MANHRRILQLLLQERPWAEIVQIAACSRRDVSKVKKAIDEHSITDSAAASDEALADWFPDRRRVTDEYVQPDFAGVLAAQRSSPHLEGLNRKVRLIVTRAFGFHSARAALALVKLACGPVTLTHPWQRTT